MKKIILIIILSFTTLFSYSQQKSIVYKATLLKVRNKSDLSKETLAKYKKHPRLRNSLDLTFKSQKLVRNFKFELIYDGFNSEFRTVPFLIPEHRKREYKYALTSVGMYFKKAFFRNKKNKRLLRSLLGEEVIVEYPLTQYNWKFSNESKIIMGFKCFKATADLKVYDSRRDINVTISFSVWYTKDLPFPYGPIGLDGLPGIVLECTSGNTTFSAIKFISNATFSKYKLPKKVLTEVELKKRREKFRESIKGAK